MPAKPLLECKGTRLNVTMLRSMMILQILVAKTMLAAGMTHKQIIDDYPDVTEEDILACLAYATP